MSAPRALYATPVALQDAHTSARWAARLARKGGRVFAESGGVLLLAVPSDDALPTATGKDALHVLVPRGMGKPLLARRARSGFLCATSGAPCAAARWHDAGAVVAHVRRAPARWQDAPLTPGGAVLALDIGNPALGVGDTGDVPVVAVSHGRVLGANKRARALGVLRGMRERELPAGVTSRPAVPPCETLRAVASWIARRAPPGASTRTCVHAGRHFVRVAGVDASAAGAIVSAAWHLLGVELRAGVAGDAETAAALARLTGTGTVAVGTGLGVPTRRSGDRWTVRRGFAAWSGASLPDLCGVAHRAVALVRALDPVGVHLLHIEGERGARVLKLSLSTDATVREGVVRASVERAAFGLGHVRAIRVAAVTRALPRVGTATPRDAAVPHDASGSGAVRPPAQVPLFRLAA